MLDSIYQMTSGFICIQDFHRNYGFVPADKAVNNVVVANCLTIVLY